MVCWGFEMAVVPEGFENYPQTWLADRMHSGPGEHTVCHVHLGLGQIETKLALRDQIVRKAGGTAPGVKVDAARVRQVILQRGIEWLTGHRAGGRQVGYRLGKSVDTGREGIAQIVCEGTDVS